jgi:hypothetical protein
MVGTYSNKQRGTRTGKCEGKGHPVDLDGIIMSGWIVRKYECQFGGWIEFTYNNVT